MMNLNSTYPMYIPVYSSISDSEKFSKLVYTVIILCFFTLFRTICHALHWICIT
jgi:hypothetical protein